MSKEIKNMKYSEAKQGRIFILRLEDGEVVHEEIEKFAQKKNIKRASVQILGGIDRGSCLVVGPEDGRSEKIRPMEIKLNDVHEVHGLGTLFPNESGISKLHLHASFGRNNQSITGCIRKGIKVWYIVEVILIELIDNNSQRILDSSTGFELLNP